MSEDTNANDWAFPDGARIWINNNPQSVREATQTLTETSHATVDIRLELDGIVREHTVAFAVADASDLDAIDHHLLELAETRVLDMAGINRFVQQGRRHPTAIRYLDGLSRYLYGALNREGSPESGLEQDEYREQYNRACAQLEGLDRAPARIIRGLVAFHFNQFDDVKRDVGSHRLYAASDRLRTCLVAHRPQTDALTQDASALDALLSDADTERLLRWVSLPVGATPEQELVEMEAYRRRCSTLDALKIDLVLAEHDLAARRPDDARRRAHRWMNSLNTADWAASILQRADEHHA